MNKVVDLAARRAAKKSKRARCLTILQNDPPPRVDLARGGYRFFTVEQRQMQGEPFYAVYGWHTRPDQQALRGQDLSRHVVATFATLEAAMREYPEANHIHARDARGVLRSLWPDEAERMSKRWTLSIFHRPPARALLTVLPKGGDMSDDLKNTGARDDARINVEQDHEVSYWSEKFGVSREELRRAVEQAGPMVKDVQRQLGR